MYGRRPYHNSLPGGEGRREGDEVRVKEGGEEEGEWQGGGRQWKERRKEARRLREKKGKKKGCRARRWVEGDRTGGEGEKGSGSAMDQ